MKGLFLILSLFLSCLFSGGAGVVAEDSSVVVAVEPEAGRGADAKADLNDMAILPSGIASYSGESNSFAPSVRSTNSGRRVQTSTRSAFRIVKAGKVLDRNNLNTFRAVILQFQSGIHSNSRYIHSICHLLI